jgi:hypothetical protein
MRVYVLMLVFAMMFFSRNIFAAGQDDLPPRIITAAELACKEFSKEIRINVDSSSSLSVFLSKIESYQIILQETGDSYVVTFTPNDYEGHTLRGGGAKYKLSKKDFRIIDVIRYK